MVLPVELAVAAPTQLKLGKVAAFSGVQLGEQWLSIFWCARRDTAITRFPFSSVTEPESSERRLRTPFSPSAVQHAESRGRSLAFQQISDSSRARRPRMEVSRCLIEAVLRWKRLTPNKARCRPCSAPTLVKVLRRQQCTSSDAHWC